MNRSVVALMAVAVALTGCGSRPARPAGTPRTTVLRFIDDLRAGRTERACAALDPAEVSDIRLNMVLSGVRPPAGSETERLQFIRRISAESKRCPVSLRLLAGQLGDQLARIRHNAASAKLWKPFPPEIWFLGNEDWVVEPHHGRWVITGAGALAVEQ